MHTRENDLAVNVAHRGKQQTNTAPPSSDFSGRPEASAVKMTLEMCARLHQRRRTRRNHPQIDPHAQDDPHHRRTQEVGHAEKTRQRRRRMKNAGARRARLSYNKSDVNPEVRNETENENHLHHRSRDRFGRDDRENDRCRHERRPAQLFARHP
ncbi:MAG: hypothetical protein MZU97_13190 [Bacillus subtilis]|nr:hypothetical protein [Bacillus subtilis]